MTYSNTNEKLYDDIALWEKTDGKDLFLQMPLKEKQSPKILDFGYGFGEQLFALANAYPKGTIFGIDGSPYCQKEVSDKITQRKISNITLINKMVNDLSDFEDDSMDLVLLYDALHATSNKYMLYEESHRILKTGGVLSILPVHLSNWRDRQGKKKTYTPKLIQSEIEEYGFSYAGTCTQKGVHWENATPSITSKKATSPLTFWKKLM